jgi:hypothetical protein
LARLHGDPGATPSPRWFAGVPLAAVVLAVAHLAAPPASAALADDVAAVGSDVNAVTEAATKALPGLPVPVEPPDLPKVPPPPPPPSASKPPPPTSTPAPPGAAATLPDGVQEVVTPAPSAVAGPAASPGPGTRGEPNPGAVAGKPGRRSVGPAEAAPMPRWRTYLWPAIALRLEAVLMPLLPRLEGLVEFRWPDAFGLPSRTAAPVVGGGIDRSSERLEPPRQDLRSPTGVALPEGEMGLLATLLVGLLTIMGLVALARLVVGEDLFESRYWRGHRG